jgi:hypothetical protein
MSKSIASKLSLWLFAALVLGTPLLADEPSGSSWELAGGQTELVLNRHVLNDVGIGMVTSTTTEREGHFEVSFFDIDGEFPTLVLHRTGGSLEGRAEGALRNRGSLILSLGEREIELSDFELLPASRDGLFEIRSPSGLPLFFLDYAHAEYAPESGEYLFLNMDLHITLEMAWELGRPELEGLTVGAAHVRSRPLARPDELVWGVCDADFTGYTDVALTGLNSLSEAFHNDTRVAMAPSATLKNVGKADVPWLGTIAPASNPGQHPFLYLALYRLANGVFEQIGASDLKHAFFSLNQGEDCSCASGGQVLYDGCEDIYGTGTNINRVYLGPRNELTAATGDWTSTGSHFDGTPVDNVRHHFGDSDHTDQFEHRLTAMASELSTPGARYFYYAWYIVKADIDIFNSMGFREFTPVFTTLWSFNDVTALETGAPLNAWVDPLGPGADAATTIITECNNVAGGDCDGHLQLAARATAAAPRASLGPVEPYRYEYALMNLDYDRQIETFSIPIPTGVNITNISFRDPDDDAGNDWVASVGPNAITWSLPNGEFHGLRWGDLYNFGFEADVPPGDVFAQLGVFEPGIPAILAAGTKGPSPAGTAVNLAVSTTGSGTVSSSPEGIDCGSDCDETYPHGTAAVLTGVGDPGSCLTAWTESNVPIGFHPDLPLTLTASRTLVAEFEPEERTLGEETVDGVASFNACLALTTGSTFLVESTGDATLRAGGRVVISDGFSILNGGQMRVEIDPSQLP